MVMQRYRHRYDGMVSDDTGNYVSFFDVNLLQAELEERKKQLESAFEILEEYTPTEKLQEANDKMILLCKGIQEEIGRDLLKNKPLQGTIAKECYAKRNM